MTYRPLYISIAILAGAVGLIFLLRYLLLKVQKHPVSELRPSQRLYDFLRRTESLELTAYPDPGGVWTIGYGHTSDEYFTVRPVSQITEDFAERLLAYDVYQAAEIVRDNVDVKLTKSQFDALVSYTYNAGSDPRLFNLVNTKAPKDAIARYWLNSRLTAGGAVQQGLVDRRKKEAEMFTA